MMAINHSIVTMMRGRSTLILRKGHEDDALRIQDGGNAHRDGLLGNSLKQKT